MSRFLSHLINVSRRSLNKHYHMSAGLIRNGKLVSSHSNGEGIYSHAETNAMTKHFQRCEKEKERYLFYYCHPNQLPWKPNELETLHQVS